MNKPGFSYYRRIRQHLHRQTNLCGICSKPIEKMKESTIDHIVPLSKGGSDHISNLQLAHEECNRLKGNTYEPENH